MSTPQRKGYEFDDEWAEVFGVKPQRGSGNLYYMQLDVDDNTMLWSCKYTSKKSFSVTEPIIKEAEIAARGMGSSGRLIPAVAIKIGGTGRLRVDLDARDYMRLLTDPTMRYVKRTSMEEKRAIADMPAALRRAVEQDDD